MNKVRRKYTESKARVWLKYSKRIVWYGKSTVLYGNFFLAPKLDLGTPLRGEEETLLFGEPPLYQTLQTIN